MQISRNFLTITALAMVLTTLFLLSPPRTGRWIPGPQNKTFSIQVSDYGGTRTPEEKENQGENIFNVGPGYSYKRIMMTPEMKTTKPGKFWITENLLLPSWDGLISDIFCYDLSKNLKTFTCVAHIFFGNLIRQIESG